MKIYLLAAVVALALVVPAASSERGRCPQLPHGTSPVIKHVAPSPLPAKTYVGTVSLVAVISDTGYVCSARVVRGIDKKRDPEAKKINAEAKSKVQSWRLTPAMKDGRGVPSFVQINVQYWREKDGQLVALSPSAPEGTK